MAEARGNQPEPVSLEVGAHLATTTHSETEHPGTVRFKGVAVSPGVYQAEGDLEIEIRREHLDAIAARLANVQIRDLHEDRIRATVGAVRRAHVEEDAVVFEGEIGLEPHATIVRRFPETVAFSVGFRFARDELDIEDGRAPLPEDFGIDHLALVGQGQDPQARLTRLLNRARPGDPTETTDDTDPTDETDDETGDGITVDDDTLDELHRQRDEALEAKDKARADLADARTRLETKNETIDELELELEDAQNAVDEAEQEAKTARMELEQARTHFADSILKLELRAGEDVEITQRREELLGMDLGELDELRLELADQAAEDEASDGPASKPADTGGSRSTDEEGVELDLDDLDTQDTIRLGLMREAI